MDDVVLTSMPPRQLVLTQTPTPPPASNSRDSTEQQVNLASGTDANQNQETQLVPFVSPQNPSVLRTPGGPILSSLPAEDKNLVTYLSGARAADVTLVGNLGRVVVDDTLPGTGQFGTGSPGDQPSLGDPDLKVSDSPEQASPEELTHSTLKFIAGLIAQHFKSGFPALELGDPTSSCLLYTSPSPRDMRRSRMPSSA